MKYHFSQSQLAVLTALVMIAFAMNSILCREALTSKSIGVADFTIARLASGTLVLWLMVTLKSGKYKLGGDWISAVALLGYAACFSIAYVTLSAGTGSLLLFSAVQLTMISWGLITGDRISPWQWLGVSLAFAGLVWLVSPGVEAPSWEGAILMVAAGLSWGIYSLRGRSVSEPTSATAGNFARSVPLALILYLVAPKSTESATQAGWILAVASGALASGVGYALWYSVLPRLSAATSATVQLSVPVIAAFGGVILLSEELTLRLVIVSAVVLGGIFIFISSSGSGDDSTC